MTEEEEKKEPEVVTLESGESINRFCMDQFNSLVTNQEAIWDVLDVVTRMTRLEVTKDPDGFVTDVELILPCANEVLATFALKNFLKHHELQSDNVSAETVLELRRLMLQKFVEG